MGDVPPIPDVGDPVAVARWFVEHDADLEYLRTRCRPYIKQWVVEDIRLAVQTRCDVRRLRPLYRTWFQLWSTRLLPRSATRCQHGRPFTELDESVFCIDAIWEAKTRILGHIVEQMAAREQCDSALED